MTRTAAILLLVWGAYQFLHVVTYWSVGFENIGDYKPGFEPYQCLLSAAVCWGAAAALLIRRKKPCDVDSR